MKKIFLIILCLVASVTMFAQETGTPKPTIAKKKKSPAKDRAFIGFSWDNWIQGEKNLVKVKPFASKGVDIAFMYDIPFGYSPISIALGLGFSSHNIHFDKMLISDKASGCTCFEDSVLINEWIVPSSDIKGKKLSTNFVEIPFELRFRTKPDKNNRRFSIAAGFKVGYLVQSHTKYQYDGNTYKESGVNNIEKIRYGATARIGYGKFSLTGFYSLTDVFNSNGPLKTPFSVGIAVVPY